MARKKITIVNIAGNDNENDEVIDTSEPVDEPIEILQEVIESLGQTVETEQVEPVEPVEPVETQTRSQELIKCPKCNKMIKAKTLKYTHKNTCIGEEKIK